MSALDNYVTMTLKLIQRNEILGHLNDSSLSDEFINDAIQEALNVHRAQLTAICPSTMNDKLNQLLDDHILYVSTEDVNLFNELTTLNQVIFEAALPMIFSKLLTKAKEINDEQLNNLDPLSNPIFLYVCKSLQEVAEQLGAHTKTDNAIIYSEALGWEVTNLQEEYPTPYSKCLRQQLQMLARLANHFEPGGPFRTSRFPYEFKLFQNMDVITESVRIWLCLLDDYMKDLVDADFDKMELLSSFFKSYVSFIASEDFQSETLECLRRITHDSLRSLADMKSSQHDRTTVEPVLLECNEMISCCLAKLPRKHFGIDCDQLEAILRQIIFQAANKNVSSDKSSTFFKAFKHLLDDISDLPFEWLIQLPPSDKRTLLLRGQFIAPVDNRWKDTEHECLKVADMEGFVKVYRALHDGDEIPRHYQLEVVQVLLQYVDELASKQSWTEGHRLSVEDQLDAMTYSINSIRSAILYLRGQPDFSCFEEFLTKMGEPFAQAIEKSRSLEDFGNRLLQVSDSKLKDFDINSIDDEETLKLISEIGGPEATCLETALKNYIAEFDRHITQTNELTREARINYIVSHVIRPMPRPVTGWTEKFKRDMLPKILAGLSAVWSLIVSKNGSTLVKPCYKHIYSVLRLFSLDLNDLKHRLLITSTREGKELVLGLTAALLVLFKNKVQIVCFNSNLARRNATTLLELLKNFTLDSMVTFGSVDDMARECSKALFEKYTNHMNQCLGLGTADSNSSDQQPQQNNESILLIDDIDVLLLENKLGQAFERFVIPTIPGLGLLQEKIFNSDVEISLERIEKFIDLSDLPEMCKLRAFRDASTYYKIPVGPSMQVKGFYNKTLLKWHLESMIHSRSQLTSDGPKTAQPSTDNAFADYTNVASYLNQKQPNFQQIEGGHKNYGYLSLNVLSFPYANLLNSFPLILSFGSEPLDRYQSSMMKIASKMHVFEELLPGDLCPTRFNSKKNFLLVSSQLEWLIAIMGGITAAIERNCSVLVFFENKLRMRQFRIEFTSQLKRMIVTAIETASNGENLTEHEISTDEVAVLAIETSEESGIHEPVEREVHVIQTFFSSDFVEEDLIRRQAERSYSGGSYEIIMLKENTIFKSHKITYDMLVKLREALCILDIKAHFKLQTENYEKLIQVCSKI
ncbi:uncharacterized protein LOC135713690 isoform X2 [Ochlerotatus camptorhynchus]